MKSRTLPKCTGGRGGFTMIELVVVVALIAIMAVVALPNIIGYVRQSSVRAAAQQIAGDLQRARNQAIVKNVNPAPNARGGGVVFAILDANTYRFTVLDDNFTVDPPDPTRGLTPIRDLPQGTVFVAGANAPVFGIGFDHLGRRCVLGASQCAPTQTIATMCPDGDRRCSDMAPGNYFDVQDIANMRVRVRNMVTGVERFVRIEQGGRVATQR